MQHSIVMQGVDLMLFGMGTVFVFLTILVVATRAMSWIANKYFPEPEPVIPSPTPKHEMGAPVDPKVLAVIQDAIHQHRAKHAK